MNRITKLEQQIPGWMETAVVPGLSMAMMQDHQLTYQQVWGVANVATGEPVTAETLFEAASLTKPLFAYIALKLWEQEVIDLDKPLLEYLPSDQRTAEHLFESPDESVIFGHIVNEPRLEQITLRHVLSHQPGFPNWTGGGKPLQLRLNPGERFSYSGDGFHYLQKVITHLTGQTAESLFRTIVFEPLGMNHSCVANTDFGRFHLAQPHNAEGEVQERWKWPGVYSAASLHCNPTDYVQFITAVMSPESEQLTVSSRREMFRPHVQVNDSVPWHKDWPRAEIELEPDVWWGLGWGLQRENGRWGIWHWGDNGNYKAFVIAWPDSGDGVVMMANGRNGQKLWQPVLRTIFNKEYPALSWLQRMYEA